MSESELDAAVAAARRGEEWAVNELFRAIQPGLLRYLARQAPGSAEDLAAETWLAAARLLPSFEGSGRDFRAVMFSIARRRLVDQFRGSARRPRLVALFDEAGPVEQDPADRTVAALDAQRAVDALVGTLPSDQAEVILLRVVADLSVDEVARIMGRTPGSVRVLQHRALRRLAQQSEARGVTR